MAEPPAPRSRLPRKKTIGISSKLRLAIEWLRDRWGWMVTVASFILYFITIGVLYCYGLLFVSLQEDFKSSATIIGWIGSLAWAFSTLTSPLTALLLRCCQTRAVALLGIVLCSSSLLLSSLVSNAYTLFAVFSIMYGMGINFAQHSTLCLIYRYFPKKNSTRTISFALAGCQVGLLALNPLMAYFVATLGWRLALRIFSAIILIPGVISCIILLPPKKQRDQHIPADPQTGERLALHQICEEQVGGASGDYKRLDSRESASYSGSSSSSALMSSDDYRRSEAHCDPGPMVRGGGDSSACKRVSCRYCLKLDGLGDHQGIGTERDKDVNRNMKQSGAMEPRMAKSPVTYFFSLALATLSLAWTFFNVNLVSYTDSVGITANHGSILLTMLAGGEMLGKALLAIFGDHVPFAKVYIIVICNVLSAAISCGMIFAKDFHSMISVAVGIGLMRAVFNTVPFGAGVEIFGTSRTAEASTLAMFSYGSGYLVGSVIPGGIYDLTGSYTLSLVYMAGVFLLSAVMFLLIALRGRLHDYLSKGCLAVLESVGKEGWRTRQGVSSSPGHGECRRCSSIINVNEAYL